ncbi:MAG: DUF4124 domain-containing protein [Magnetococcales bacterium]|nr:DUF4124 domain-containing protein [Magnetococcales bacterium]
MKLIYKLMVLVLLLAFAVPFITGGPGGKPLLKPPPVMRDLETPDIGGMVDSVRDAMPGETSAEKRPATGEFNKVYRWTDAKGTVNLTSTPPPEGVPFKTIRMDSSANVVPAYKPPPEVEAKIQARRAAIAANAGSGSSGGQGGSMGMLGGDGQITLPGIGSAGDVMNLYSPDNIKNVINQAQGMQGLVDERKSSIDRQIEEMQR